MRVQIAHTSVALNKTNTIADCASSTTPLTRTTQMKRGKPRTSTTDDAKVTQVELWRLEKCDLRIEAWEAREIQLEVRVGAKHECLSTWVARLKHERNEEVLRDCLFPQFYTNPCGKEHMVFTEGDDIRELSAIVSFKTDRRRVAQTSSQLMCNSFERSASSFQECLFSDSGQSQFKRAQFIRTGCLMISGIERWESYEGNKPGQLCKDCSKYKKRTAEKGNKPKGRELKQQL